MSINLPGNGSICREGSILLCMNDRSQAETLAGGLEKYGYPGIEICPDPEASFESPGKKIPEVIICGLQPGEDPDAAGMFRQIRDKYDIPVIYLAGSPDEKLPDDISLEKIMETDPHALLCGPVNLSEIRVAIDSALSRKRKPDKPAKSTDGFYRQFENGDVPFHVLDPGCRLISVNRAWIEMTGYPEDEVMNKWFGDLLSRDSRKRFMKNLAVLKEKGIIRDQEYTLLKKDRHEISVSVSCLINLCDSTEIHLICCILNDTTGRNLLQRQLLESEEKYRSLVELMEDIIIKVDRKGFILAAGGKSLEKFEPDPDRLDGKNLDDLFGKEVLTEETKKKLFDQEISSTFDLSLRCDGSDMSFSVTGSPLRDTTGKVRSAGLIFRDLTRLKASESALMKTEQWLLTVLSHAPVTIYATDERGIFTLHEGKKVEAAGMKPGENVGVSAFDLYSSLSWKENNGAVTNGSDVLRRVLKGEKVDGTTELNGVHFDNHLAPIYDRDNRITGTVGIATDITNHIKMGQALIIALEKYRIILETFPIGIILTDDSGHISEANPESERILGMSRREQLNERYDSRDWKMLRPDGTPMPYEEYPGTIALEQDRPVKDIESGIENSMGKVTWVTGSAAPVPLEGYGVVVAYHDITTRKTAEEALVESERRYKDLADKAGIAIMTDDAEGRITYFNLAFARLFGYTMKEMKLQSRETLILREDLRQLVSCHKRIIRGEEIPGNYEIRGMHKQGYKIWIEVKVSLLREVDTITGTRNYLWDITERKKMVQDLMYSETRFRELFSHMSSGVAVYEYDPVKKDFIFKDLNKSGMVITRVEHKKDVLNKGLLECFPGAKTLGLWDALKRVNQTGISENIPASEYYDDRLKLHVENYIYKLPSGEVVTVYDDISEKLRAERSLFQSYEKIQKLVQHLENIREEERKYIAGELHDEFGQILTAVKMDVSWIRNRIKTDRAGIRKRARSTIQIIDEAISKVQHLSMELRPRMLDDFGLLETLHAYFKDFRKRTGIAVRYRLPEDEPELIPGQEILVFRIVQEALNNAVRHSGASEIVLDFLEEKNKLLIVIMDNGTGIPEKDAQSYDSLGIMIMRDRVSQWNGKIEISGKQGKGTTIHVEIPIEGMHADSGKSH